MPNMDREFQTFALMAGVVLVGANAFVLSPIMAELAAALRCNPVRIGYAISAFGAATALSALVLSPLLARYGFRLALTGSAGVLGVAQMLCMASGSWLWLCAAQILAGCAAGVFLPGIYAATLATARAGQGAARLGRVLTGWAWSLVLVVPLAAAATEQAGWRAGFGGGSLLSALVALAIWKTIPPGIAGHPRGINPLDALRLPGVMLLLAVMFGYMSAFYGFFAYFGEGLRWALGISAARAGSYVLAYGMGFGLAGLGAGRLMRRLTRPYLLCVLTAIGASYLAWRLALHAAMAAYALAAVWGFLNQLGLNALLVFLNRRAAGAPGTIMGLNCAVTYGAVFAGPLMTGVLYQQAGFPAVATFAAIMTGASVIAVSAGGARPFRM